MKKIVEAAPTMPVPVETISLPTGSFCNRCGNRVPPESVFCNRCGTPVVQDTDTVDTPEWTSTAVRATVLHRLSRRSRSTPSPVFPTITDKKDRPIEQVIHSIEPLIEDSVPRTAPAPLVPAKQVHIAHPADIAEPADQVIAAATNEETGDAAAAPQPGDVTVAGPAPVGNILPGRTADGSRYPSVIKTNTPGHPSPAKNPV